MNAVASPSTGGAEINRTMITVSIMLATIIQALDGTTTATSRAPS